MRYAALFAAAALIATPASAKLAAGAKAPDFTTRGAVAGKVVPVHLAALLKKGPVVLYFFPSAFTGGCNAEAAAFAEKIPAFTAAGATVIGMSANSVPVLQRFSTEKCAGKFTVASAGPAVVKNYDVSMGKEVDIPGVEKVAMTNRVSYVIAQNGNVVSVHSDIAPTEHVALTLATVQKLKLRD
jgi:thioredoxin-dependent peroxiredoxin